MAQNDVSVSSLFNTKRIEVDQEKRAYVVDDDDHYRMYLKVHTEDLDALSDSDKVLWMDQFGQMLRTYPGDLKMIVATSKVDTSVQQFYYRRKFIDANRMLSKEMSPRKLQYWKNRAQLAKEVMDRDITISRNNDNLNFYLICFAETKKALIQSVRLLVKAGGQTFKLRYCTAEETEDVHFRMCNLNED